MCCIEETSFIFPCFQTDWDRPVFLSISPTHDVSRNSIVHSHHSESERGGKEFCLSGWKETGRAPAIVTPTALGAPGSAEDRVTQPGKCLTELSSFQQRTEMKKGLNYNFTFLYFKFLLLFFKISKTEKENSQPLGSLPKRLQQPGGQSLGFPYLWQEPNYLNHHHCLPGSALARSWNQ